MSNNLTKEQLLILQDNLPFNAYEKFMNLFEKEDMLPNDTDEFTDKIIQLMKDHEYWGEIHGWGPERFYKRITKHKVNIIMTFGNFKDKSSDDFIGWMNRSRYHDMLSGFTDVDMLKVEEINDDAASDSTSEGTNWHTYIGKSSHEVPMSTRWLNDNKGW